MSGLGPALLNSLEMGLLPRQRRLLAQVLDLASDAGP